MRFSEEHDSRTRYFYIKLPELKIIVLLVFNFYPRVGDTAPTFLGFPLWR